MLWQKFLTISGLHRNCIALVVQWLNNDIDIIELALKQKNELLDSLNSYKYFKATDSGI